VRPNDMRRLSDDELRDQLRSAREELFNLRFQLATRQLKDYRDLPAARRRIARALTILSERERAAGG
jgi:large subunit ribosomal protein L29